MDLLEVEVRHLEVVGIARKINALKRCNGWEVFC
jgi:hypothetical protein